MKVTGIDEIKGYLKGNEKSILFPIKLDERTFYYDLGEIYSVYRGEKFIGDVVVYRVEENLGSQEARVNSMRHAGVVKKIIDNIYGEVEL